MTALAGMGPYMASSGPIWALYGLIWLKRGDFGVLKR